MVRAAASNALVPAHLLITAVGAVPRGQQAAIRSLLRKLH